jgi:hypothetical protein
MSGKERVLDRERDRGRLAAREVQDKSPNMTGTELYAVDDRVPRFVEAIKHKNMLERPAGFVCKTSAGRVVKLLQPYDSTIYTAEPEEFPALWGFVWSQDPAKALPFVAISTSPYMNGDCCIDGDNVYRSKIDNNVWKPSEYLAGWEVVDWK